MTISLENIFLKGIVIFMPNTVNMVFTNNFYVWISTLLFSETNDNGVVFTNGTYDTYAHNKILGSLKSINGVVLTNYLSDFNNGNGKVSNLSFSLIGNLNNGSTYISVGSSKNQEPSGTDYCLESLLSNMSISLSGEHFSEDGYGVLSINMSITNNNAEKINISEFGLNKNIVCGGDGNYPAYTFLMARGILDTPLEINPSDTKSLTMILKMPLTAN